MLIDLSSYFPYMPRPGIKPESFLVYGVMIHPTEPLSQDVALFLYFYLSLNCVLLKHTDGILFILLVFSVDTALGTQLWSVDFHCVGEVVKDRGERHAVSS